MNMALYIVFYYYYYYYHLNSNFVANYIMGQMTLQGGCCVLLTVTNTGPAMAHVVRCHINKVAHGDASYQCQQVFS